MSEELNLARQWVAKAANDLFSADRYFSNVGDSQATLHATRG